MEEVAVFSAKGYAFVTFQRAAAAAAAYDALNEAMVRWCVLPPLLLLCIAAAVAAAAAAAATCCMLFRLGTAACDWRLRRQLGLGVSHFLYTPPTHHSCYSAAKSITLLLLPTLPTLRPLRQVSSISGDSPMWMKFRHRSAGKERTSAVGLAKQHAPMPHDPGGPTDTLWVGCLKIGVWEGDLKEVFGQ